MEIDRSPSPAFPSLHHHPNVCPSHTSIQALCDRRTFGGQVLASFSPHPPIAHPCQPQGITGGVHSRLGLKKLREPPWWLLAALKGPEPQAARRGCLARMMECGHKFQDRQQKHLQPSLPSLFPIRPWLAHSHPPHRAGSSESQSHLGLFVFVPPLLTV